MVAAETLREAVSRLRHHMGVLRRALPPRRTDGAVPPPPDVLHVPVVWARDAAARGSTTLTREQLVAVLDLVPEAVTIWSPDFHNRFSNAAARAFYADGDALEGRHGSDVLGMAAYQASLPAGLAAMRGVPQEFVRSSGPGEPPRHVRVAYVGQFDGDGRAVGAVALVTDITAEVEGQRALERATREGAVAEDRTRIAEDIHDRVVQALFAASLLVSLDAADDWQLDQALAGVAHAQEHLRTAILDVDPASVPDVDVGDMVARAVGDVVSPGTVPVTLDIPEVVVLLPAVVAWDVAAVASEGVSNALRHARASRVEVVLAVAGDWLTLSVADDGEGLIGASRSSGLANLAARARRHGGRLDLPSTERGTRLVWSIPVEPG